jgi:hypothetical protein
MFIDKTLKSVKDYLQFFANIFFCVCIIVFNVGEKIVMKNFFKRKGILCMYLYFAIIPLFCVLLDMFMSTISPDPEYGDRVNNFDFSMINQVIYFSV